MNTDFVIRVVGPVRQDGPHDFDGRYAQFLSFSGCGPGEVNFKTTANPAAAAGFPSVVEALEFWKTVDPRRPVRPDGQPNRPLTAFTVSVEPRSQP